MSALKKPAGSILALFVILVLALTGVPVIAQDGGQAVTVVDAYGNEVTITDTSRVVTIGGSVTEIVFAIGAADLVVARDDSSLYPPQVNDLESVGYLRTLSAEPVLALDPTLIITTTDAGPEEAVEQLKASGVTFLVVPGATSIEGIVANTRTIATALGHEAEAEEVIARLETDFGKAQELLETIDTTPRVMFIYARGAGAISVAGTNTSADTMIALAGGENAVTEYEGYQPITAEAVVTAAPDVILMMTGGLESIGGVEGLLEQPGIAQTPAGENGRVVAMEDLYLLGFSTRTGTAVLDLAYLLHEELDAPIITLLRASGRFNNLLTAIGVAGQTELLSNEGEYTLFAPTDDAFAALPPGLFEGLLSSPISVQAVLSFHILPGIYDAEALAGLNGQTVQTLYSNGVLAVTADDSGITLNGASHVTESDWVASNGVVHVIDAILLPERP